MNLCKYNDCYECFKHWTSMAMCDKCPCLNCIHRCKKAEGVKGHGQDYYKPP